MLQIRVFLLVSAGSEMISRVGYMHIHSTLAVPTFIAFFLVSLYASKKAYMACDNIKLCVEP